MPGVQLDDDLIRILEERRRVPDAGRQVDLAVGGDLGRLDDRHVDRPEEALEHDLRDVRQVHVDEVELARVGELPQRGRREIRARQLNASASPSSSSQAAPVEAPLSSRTWNGSPAAWRPGPGGPAPGHRLGRTGRREAAHADHRPGRDQSRRLFSREFREWRSSSIASSNLGLKHSIRSR